MRVSMTKTQVPGENMASSNGTLETGVERDRILPKIGESRLVDLMQALRRFSSLQQEAANAQIDARQKMREVGIKRQLVWTADAKFMKEVQRRMAQSISDGYEELTRLASECQDARDNLGPLEQEGIEAEQLWEGAFWRLRQAEGSLYEEFGDEFNSATSYSSPATSAPSSQHESSLEVESQDNRDDVAQGIGLGRHTGGSRTSSSSFAFTPYISEPPPRWDESQGTTLLGLDETLKQQLGNQDHHAFDSDSGIGDIDRLPDAAEDFFGRPQLLPYERHPSIELYPHLLTNFSSIRDRINKWLQHTTLVSRFEADLLKEQLAMENPKTPSNWSQLVIAYWELDEAASPSFKRPKNLDPSSQHDITRPPTSAVANDVSQSDFTSQPSKAINPRLWSPVSSNPDHGYFSDFRSQSIENLKAFMVPLRKAPQRPQLISVFDASQDRVHEIPKEPEIP